MIFHKTIRIVLVNNTLELLTQGYRIIFAVKLEEGGRDLDLHLYSFLFFSYCFSCKIQSHKMQDREKAFGKKTIEHSGESL